MCRGSDIGRFTGYYCTFSMVAQVVTPIAAGSLMRAINYRVLFPYAAIFSVLSFVTMCFVRHGDAKAEAKKGLEAFSRTWMWNKCKKCGIFVDNNSRCGQNAAAFCMGGFCAPELCP